MKHSHLRSALFTVVVVVGGTPTGCIVVAGNYLCDEGRCPAGQTCNADGRCALDDGDDGDDDGAEGEGEAPEGEGEGEAAEGEGEGEGEAPLQWAGTWATSVSISVSCTVDDDVVEDADTTAARAVVITGPNSALNAAIDIVYELDGVGSQQRLTMAGTFPVVGTRNESARFNTTDLTISADVVDANTAAGSIAGTFTTTEGHACVINSGTVSLSR